MMQVAAFEGYRSFLGNAQRAKTSDPGKPSWKPSLLRGARPLVLARGGLVGRLQLIDTRVVGILDCLQTRIVG